MARDRAPTILTPQTSLESVASEGNSETMKSPWSRLRKRLHEVTGRATNRRSKYGSLLKLAGEERRFINYSRRFPSQVQLIPTEDGVTALWREIHLLEERVEVLENTLEASREQIAKTEEKYSKLHKQVEKLLMKQLHEPPLDAVNPPDGEALKEKMRLCFEQIRNREFQLNYVETCGRTSDGASRHSRKCAGCGKSTF